MLDVAIVEDDDMYAKTLSEYLDRYSCEKGEKFGVTRYAEAVSFLENYRPHFAIVLMDIELPMMDGMEAARKMREKDGNVCLIFVTNMAQFACDGYGVDALDFIVKPVSYADFAMKLDRAVTRARKNMGEELYIPVAGGGYRVQAADIVYVEVTGHRVTYHMPDGKVIESRDTLGAVEDRLAAYGFLRCSKCYLVNPRHITSVEGLKITFADGEIFMSRGKRREFLGELASWRSGR